MVFVVNRIPCNLLQKQNKLFAQFDRLTSQRFPLNNFQFIRKASTTVLGRLSAVQIPLGAELQHAVRIFVVHSLLYIVLTLYIVLI